MNFTRQERLVAAKVAEGYIDREIADELRMTPNRLRTLKTSVYQKLGIAGPGIKRRIALTIAVLQGRI